jgi:hypothetical protein
MHVVATNKALAKHSQIEVLEPPEVPDAKKSHFPFARNNNTPSFFKFVFLLHFDVDVFCIVLVKLKSDFFTGFPISGVSAPLSFVEEVRVLGPGEEEVLYKLKSERLLGQWDQEQA